jgi:UDP-N-acetylmuramoyl-tripeptide--D-alanyl-D-alanine ligase
VSMPTTSVSSKPMMSLEQAARWLPNSELLGSGDVAIRRVHTDTRSIEAGDLFVALKGDNFDGNLFLAEAKAKGAVAAISGSSLALAQSGLCGLVVNDTLEALATLAGAWRAQFSLPLIAVAGSNGKTTVTQMIAAILQAHAPGAMLATQGNFNNDIGVPLTLLRLRPQHRIAVVELGMNHPGEIAHLAKVAQANIALVNNAQREHLEFMATVEAVAQENGAVLASLPPGGTAVFPQDDAFSGLWRRLAAPRACITFASGADPAQADVICVSADWSENAWRLQVKTPAGHLALKVRIAGRHNVSNALAAVACALAAGVPLSAIAEGLANFEPIRGRSRSVAGMVGAHRFTLIDDTYNANPDSVKAAIEVLASLPAPRLLVLGDMGEVGERGPQFHAEAGAHAKSIGIEGLCTMGELSERASVEFGSGRHFYDIQLLNDALRQSAVHYNSVLVKGSRFMRMERVVNALQGVSAVTGEAQCH